MPIGIMDTRILITYFVSAFISNLNKPRNIQLISFHNITKVLSTVATCTAMVKVRLSSPCMPNNAEPIAR